MKTPLLPARYPQRLSMHIHGSWVVALLEVLEASGCERGQLLNLLHLRENDDFAQARHPVHRIVPLWQLATERLGARAGIAVAEHFRPPHCAELGPALLSCRDVREIIERMTQFSRLMTNALYFNIRAESPQSLTFRTRFAFPQVLEASRVEAYVGASFQLIRLLIPEPIIPHRVELMREQPTDCTPWQRLFGDNLSWGHDCISVHIGADVLSAGVPGADTSIAALHHDYLQQQLIALDDEDLIAQVRQHLRHQVGQRIAYIDFVATQLNMSGRTLQRRLQTAGIPFRELLHEVRLELAQHYLSNTHLPLGEIAERLGYRHQSNFTLAFRSKMTCSPTQYRYKAQLEMN